MQLILDKVILQVLKKLSRREFFVQGKIPNPLKQPAYLKNGSVNFTAREKFIN